MTVRAATLSDIPAMCALGKHLYDMARRIEFVEWDAPSFGTTCRAIIEGRVLGGAFVFEVDNIIVGTAALLISPFFYNVNECVGMELFWYSMPGQRAGIPLLDAMEEFAKARGARAFAMSALSGKHDPVFTRLYTRRGYRASEISFIKAL